MGCDEVIDVVCFFEAVLENLPRLFDDVKLEPHVEDGQGGGDFGAEDEELADDDGDFDDVFG